MTHSHVYITCIMGSYFSRNTVNGINPDSTRSVSIIHPTSYKSALSAIYLKPSILEDNECWEIQTDNFSTNDLLFKLSIISSSVDKRSLDTIKSIIDDKDLLGKKYQSTVPTFRLGLPSYYRLT